ncbi:cbb3-type cytochrome oxidase assembly protein CcoS [Denitromonas ohlonensis]|uniref:Cbb3-type cytochrome oxidase assembly protein CcoS n=2 Tax=Denitromonas TaxID=139331 RepID=A0A557R5G6_9RHOO|nr:cbb3-type cytochrome oxidase assembly protein CcoS [Denitromonas ohlonensis]TVO60405.1 cbb3-type cytochrome oxidase assembly protein CcoS [Denitromonas ohlonensis]TVO78570.1 cbb3-type cytochrome oxidase assembly protein CcoS [Denitromonas ohlonensis]
MDSLYLLIPLSVFLVFVIGLLFWWSVRSGQFDDLEGPAYRMMMDDDKPPSAKDADGPAGNTPKNGRDVG